MLMGRGQDRFVTREREESRFDAPVTLKSQVGSGMSLCLLDENLNVFA